MSENNQTCNYWKCKGCENLNCNHIDNCFKCSGKKVYLALAPSPSDIIISNNNDIANMPSLIDQEINDQIPLIMQVAPPQPQPSTTTSEVTWASSPISLCDSVAPGRYICETCDSRFSTKKHLSKHINKAHLNDLLNKGIRFKCPHCSNTYLKEKSKHSFNKHLRQEHGISPPSESSMSLAAAVVSSAVPARPPVAPAEEVPAETVKIHIQLEKKNTKKSYRFPKTCTIESFIDFLNDKHGYLGDVVYKGQVLEKVRTFAEYDVNNLDELEYR